MNATVAAAMTNLADLAYDVYVETLQDLRAVRTNTVELIDRIDELAQSTGSFEAEAVSLALCDCLAGAPQRSSDQFREFIVPKVAPSRCAIIPGTLRRLGLIAHR